MNFLHSFPPPPLSHLLPSFLPLPSSFPPPSFCFLPPLFPPSPPPSSESELQVDDRSHQPVTTLPFTELDLVEEQAPHKPHNSFQLLPATSEISASIIDNPLESSVELGVDIAMSSSQNNTVGEQLMSQHLAGGNSRPQAFQWSEHSSAFFKPIVSGVQGGGVETSETDEEKSHHLIKPTPAPSIFLNDSNVALRLLSPTRPRYSGAKCKMCSKRLGGL